VLNDLDLQVGPGAAPDARLFLGTVRYHRHLDSCAQCATMPFQPCGIGERLLRAAAQAAESTLAALAH